MKKICVYIPTHNHPICVQYYLKNRLETFKKLNIDLYISDSTQGDEVKRIVENYYNSGLTNVMYLRSKIAPQKEIDEACVHYENYTPACYKVFVDERMLADKYDYIWLCGDGIIINIDLIIKDLIKYTDCGYDIIHFNDMTSDYGQEKVYTDPVDFYRNEVYHLTLYGASLLSSKVVKKISTNELLKKYHGSGFQYVMSIFEYCAMNSFRAITSYRKAFVQNPYKKASGWKINKKAFQVWANNWVIANNLLPDVYNYIKPFVIRNMSKYNDNLFEFPFFLKHRLYGSYSIRDIRRFRKYLPLVGNTPLFCYYLGSIIPRRLIIILYKSGLYFKKTYLTDK